MEAQAGYKKAMLEAQAGDDALSQTEEHTA